MIKNTLVCLMLLCAIISQAQTITIKDQQSNMPLEMVSIISEGQCNYTLTNAQGQADISAFKGLTKIQIRMISYKTITLSYAELEVLKFEILLEPSNLNLEEVIISGTRWRHNSDNIPSKIVQIPMKEVNLQNPQTAADLLGISAKVYIQKSQQGGGSPLIRGFATNRLLYTVDGVRMNTAIFRGGNLQNVISLDPFAMESAEVLFGPGSVIYGSDAIGGVMNFQTLTPQLSLNDKPLITGKVLTRYSSANSEKTGHFNINIGLKKWAFVTSFSSMDFGNLQQGSNGPDEYLKPYNVVRIDDMDVVVTQDNPLLQIPSAYSQMNIMQKVRYKPNEKWDFQYGFHYSETSPYGRYDRHNRVKKGNPKYAEWNYGPQKWMMNNLSINNYSSNMFYNQMSIRIAQQSFEESRIDRGFNKNDRTTNTENVEAYSINLDFTKKLSSKHKLYYGSEYVLNNVTSSGLITDITSGVNTVGPARYPNSTWTSIGVYVNEEYEVTNKFSLQTGLRYNQNILDANFSNNIDFYPFSFTFANINKGSLTGSFGGVYRPNSTTVISTNFGTAFRAPNVDDIGKVFDSEPGAVTVPNTNLEAEYAYNLDIGIAKVFGDFLKVDATAYYIILNNAMVRRDFQLNGQDSIMYDGEISKVQALQNAAVANVYGLQASLEVKLLGGLSFSSDINYQVGEEEMDDGSTSPSRHAAPLFGTSRLNYKMNKLHLQLYSVYQAERKFEDLAISEQSKDEIYAKDSDRNNYSPAWYTLNIKAVYDISKTFSISAGLENISDQRYRSYSSGISAPGRNFILSLRANF